jgi:hypothetical protein
MCECACALAVVTLGGGQTVVLHPYLASRRFFHPDEVFGAPLIRYERKRSNGCLLVRQERRGDSRAGSGGESRACRANGARGEATSRARRRTARTEMNEPRRRWCALRGGGDGVSLEEIEDAEVAKIREGRILSSELVIGARRREMGSRGARASEARRARVR